MKVAELIAKLQKLPSDAEVQVFQVYDPDENPYPPLGGWTAITSVNYCDSDNTIQLDYE
jgi:hypothetical protein